MRRPTVLHHVEHWARPSEGFVVDTIRSTTATRAVVAVHRRVPDSAAAWPGRTWDLSRSRGALPPDKSLGALPAGARDALWSPVPVSGALAAVAVLERAAVLHAHFGFAAPWVWRAARRLGRPYAVSLHGWDALVTVHRDPHVADAVRSAALVVVPSRFLAGVAEGFGVDPELIRVVPSGLDLASLPFRERTAPAGVPLVTFAGRFAPKKGVLDVAEALAVVAATRPLRVRFVGSGPLEAELRALLAARRLDAEIVDGRPAGAVRAALAETDLAVTASRTAPNGDAESLGLVNLEAQACGVPLVTTRHGGVPEAVSADGAVLVDEHGDIPTQLAAAVTRLLDAPDRWAAMGRAGRAHVAANFELGARTADLEELWLALAAGARGAALPAVRAVPPPPARTAVVLVTHNRRELVDRALDAIAAQTRAPDEVVVVDNGSTDGTAELLARRSDSQSPMGLKVLSRNENRPVAESRNLAAAATSADVIAFTDDDCRPRPTWLEALLAGRREGVGLVQGRTGADPAQPLRPLSRTQWTPAEFGLYETCNIAYERSALQSAPPSQGDGPFDLAFAENIATAVGERWGHLPFGEDTELGWRVKSRGVASRFAVHAVVDHEVWPPDPSLLRRRAALAAGFPALVRRVPELRETFLWHRVVLGRHRALFWLAVGGVAAAGGARTPWPAVAVAPYAVDLVGGLRALARPGRRARIAAAPVILAKDLLETAALLRGSVRARRFVV
ncbi:MAG: glycosyltransferase [Frankiales bacterium]|nr:glycosyltransferase [Frankiales bacterium]